MVNWAYFPQTRQPEKIALDVVRVFEKNYSRIDSTKNKKQESNQVLSRISKDLKTIGFKVETGKKKNEKIYVPVLFGRNGKVEKAFEADAYHKTENFVLEVEAGRGVTNYQFLKDLFQACMMNEIEYLGIGVRNIYRSSKDFEKVFMFFDTLFKSNRLQLPLKGILIIGY